MDQRSTASSALQAETKQEKGKKVMAHRELTL
jgi:hypothetical protein